MLNQDQIADYASRMEQVLRETIFASREPSFFTSEDYKTTLNDQLHRRYRLFKHVVLPWIQEIETLSNSLVLEVGCGSGCSASAFASSIKQLIGFEINARSVEAFKKRMQILEIDNCKAINKKFSKDEFLITSKVSPQIILLMATLEHMTFEERFAVLSEAWEILASGGLMVVTDTPNGLSPFDLHSTDLPFYHWLSNDIRSYYAQSSPRAGISGRVRRSAGKPKHERHMLLAREGIGITYHDFEVAIGKHIHSCVVADGTEKIIRKHVGQTFEDSLIQLLFDHYKIPANRCFARRSLYFILRKP